MGCTADTLHRGVRPHGLPAVHAPCAAPPRPGGFENGFFENAFFENAFFENFANFWRARSRLYQNEILQENMRSTAFFKLDKICILLHRCNLKIFAKNRFEKTAIFVKCQQEKLQMSQKKQNFVKFQKCQLENLVDFENAAKRIFSCKNRSRYSRKRSTFCRNFADRPSCRRPEPPRHAVGLARRGRGPVAVRRPRQTARLGDSVSRY